MKQSMINKLNDNTSILNVFFHILLINVIIKSLTCFLKNMTINSNYLTLIKGFTLK
jgi:hypothetical protein